MSEQVDVRADSRVYNRSIAAIIGVGDDVRVQNPAVKVTKGKNPRYYIRPYVDKLANDGRIRRDQPRVYLGHVSEMGIREARTEARRALDKINRRQYVLQSQLRFGDFLDSYLKDHVAKLAASTQEKYKNHIKNHIRPAFGEHPIGEVTMRAMDGWLDRLGKPHTVTTERNGKTINRKVKLSYNTRLDLRNIMCGIFTTAARWGLWREANPAIHLNVGRARAAREKRKLTEEQTIKLLSVLPETVRLICSVALFCGLRISEVLGLQWKHIDLERGALMVRQRWYRGDLDTVKSQKSERDVALGYLADDLKRIRVDDHDAFVFNVPTHVGRYKAPKVCRDDRSINQHFLRPAARELGLYYIGFGFHALRREAVTEMDKRMGSLQVQRMVGHATEGMSGKYTLRDLEEQDKAIRDWQERIMGKTPEDQKPS